MDPAPRYSIAALVAALLTAGVALAPGSEGPIPVLAGIAVVTFVGTALVLVDPAPFRERRERPNWAAGAFAGAATFGTLALLIGAGSTDNIGAGVLGLVLAWTGFAAGVVHQRE
ncbi:hypothetical protein [Halostella litorea]|uniref:hypothetical protein n=1 Tax=Halostella litorea TaxID=2528831 RepID=UPI001092E4CD|nr:hypothetical protein [Halostella litorea]